MLLRLDMALAPPSLGTFLASKVHPILQVRAQNRFREEGDDVSGKWLALSPYTENIRRSMGYGAAHPINRRTGRLENYITNSPSNIQVTAAGARLRFPGTAPTGELFEKVETAQVGIQGGKRSQGAVPARPVLGVNERDLELILVALATHIQTGGLAP